MLLAKIGIWLLLYPLTVTGFFILSLFEWIHFLFNSPVDVWNVITKSIKEAYGE
jgi:hypothetical protein